MKVDRRTERDPALLPERITGARAPLRHRAGRVRRIAGYDCQAIVLKPKDNLRYGYRLYADTASGMLLKAVTVDPGGEPVEQFSFTQLAIGGVTRDMVKPRRFAANGASRTPRRPARLAGWGFAELPGFQKVASCGGGSASRARRAAGVFRRPGRGVGVHRVARRAQRPGAHGLASMGAIHIYTREVANHMVTVVGAPAASVQRIADAVEYRRPQ